VVGKTALWERISRRIFEQVLQVWRSGSGEILIESFEKCSILFKIKPPAPRAYAPEGKAKILNTGIHDKYFED
jgi:hypothetical protein